MLTELPEILNVWLQENCPKWQVWYGAFIEIAPKEDWARWNLATKFWMSGTQVYIHVWRRLKNEVKCTHISTLNASDPNFFNKLKRSLRKYEKQFKKLPK